MKRLDQDHIHPLLEHHETNMSRPGIGPRAACFTGEQSSKELSIRRAYAVAIRNLYNIFLCPSSAGTLLHVILCLLSSCVSPPRNGIAEAMVWCIEHADSGDEVIECLAESLSILEVSRHTKNPKPKKKFSKKKYVCASPVPAYSHHWLLQTPVVKKIARLFLISDILHNCTVKGIPNVSFYRTGFQVRKSVFFSLPVLIFKKESSWEQFQKTFLCEKH